MQPLADVLYGVSTVIFGLLPFIFPNGRFEPGWIRWLVIPITALSTLGVFSPQMGIANSNALFAVLILAPFISWFFLAIYKLCALKTTRFSGWMKGRM